MAGHEQVAGDPTADAGQHAEQHGTARAQADGTAKGKVGL